MRLRVSQLKQLIKETLWRATPPGKYGLPPLDVVSDSSIDAGRKAADLYRKQHNISVDPLTIDLQGIDKIATVYMSEDELTFTLEDGTVFDLSGESLKKIVDLLEKEGIVEIKATEDGGATGLYGDLAPGSYSVGQFIDWAIHVGGGEEELSDEQRSRYVLDIADDDD